jgi:hypothetical protein
MPQTTPPARRLLAGAVPLTGLALLLGGATLVEAQLVVNEVDYDQTGTDAAEYIEIKNVSAATVDLDPYSVELVNGAGGGAIVYLTIALPAFSLAPGAYYVICGNAANVPMCNLDVTPDTNLIQNGDPDAVAIRLAAAVIDTVSYGGVTGAPYTEGGVGAPTDPVVGSISRIPDGIDTNNNAVDFVATPIITPGAPNAVPVELQEFRVE